MNPISGIGDFSALEKLIQTKGGSLGDSDAPTFKEFMLQSIDKVNSMQMDANKAIEMLTTGGDVRPAEVLTAIQRADMSFRMLQQVRNKLVQAYQEIKEIRI